MPKVATPTTISSEVWKSVIAINYGTKPKLNQKQIRRQALIDWAKQVTCGCPTTCKK